MKSGEAKLFAGILVVAIALSAIAIYPSISRSAGGAPPPPPPKKVDLSRATLIPSWSHRDGDPKAPYTLVEFGDYQCPTCAKAQGEVAKLLTRYRTKMNLVVHYLQVNPSHQNSPTLSLAVEAAALQGKFWQMHTAIYQGQAQFENANTMDTISALTKLAGQQKLDVLRFRGDIQGDATRNAVQREVDLARSLDIHQTPTFFFVPPQGQPTQITGTAKDLKGWLDKPVNWK